MNSIRKNLSDFFLEAAELLCNDEKPIHVNECIVMIQAMGYDSIKARDILRASASLPLANSNSIDEQNTSQSALLRWKRKLDRAAILELKTGEVCLELFKLGSDLDTPITDDERHSEIACLIHDMKQLKSRLANKTQKWKQRIVSLIDVLLSRLHNEAKDVDEETCDCPFESEFGELSIEHELHNIGNSLYKLGMFNEALEAYNMALEVNKDLLETYFNRGLCYCRLQNYTIALEDISKVIKMNDNLAEAYYTRGLVFEYMHNYDEAIVNYEEALKIDDQYEKAHSQLNIARQKKTDYKNGQTNQSSGSETYKDGIISDFSIFLLKSPLRWADVAGCTEAVRLMKKIALYLQGDPVVDKWGANVPAGVLLAGPPGVGKTQCIRALAGEVGCPVFSLAPSALMDLWAGNTEKNIRGLWQHAIKFAPSVIYIDEIDGFLSNRSKGIEDNNWYNKAVTTILYLMSNVSEKREKVVLVGATNRLNAIDEAFFRPGRFDTVCHIDLPTAKDFAELWLVHLGQAEQRAKCVDFLSPEIRKAVHYDRKKWATTVMDSKSDDSSGIINLSHRCEQLHLTGADVVGVLNSVIDDRIESEKELGVDQGAITPSDLFIALENYRPPKHYEDRNSKQDDDNA